MEEKLQEQFNDTAVDILEAVGDNLLFDDGLLKDLPIVGTAVSIAKISKTITDRIFLSKVKRFIDHLHEIPEREQQEFYEKLNREPKIRKKTGETILLLLNRFDDLEKPELLAQVFMSYIKNVISFDQFRKLASAIDLASVEDLRLLAGDNMSEAIKQELLRTGLTAISQHGVATQNAMGGGNVVYSPIVITDLGELFIKIIKSNANG